MVVWFWLFNRNLFSIILDNETRPLFTSAIFSLKDLLNLQKLSMLSKTSNIYRSINKFLFIGLQIIFFLLHFFSSSFLLMRKRCDIEIKIILWSVLCIIIDYMMVKCVLVLYVYLGANLLFDEWNVIWGTFCNSLQHVVIGRT